LKTYRNVLFFLKISHRIMCLLYKQNNLKTYVL